MISEVELNSQSKEANLLLTLGKATQIKITFEQFILVRDGSIKLFSPLPNSF